LFTSNVHAAPDEIQIKAGTSKITGRLTSANQQDPSNILVNLTVPLPISGEYIKYEGKVDKSGQFSIDVNLETSISLIIMSTSINPDHSLIVKLKNGGTTNLDIAYDLSNAIKEIRANPAMPENDILQGFEVLYSMIVHRSGRPLEELYSKNTDYFLDHAERIVDERAAIIRNDTRLTPSLKQVLEREIKFYMYRTHVFDYEAEMLLNYRNVTQNEDTRPDLKKVDRTYFRFLKDLKLEDSQYLLGFSFFEFQRDVLRNEILSLPSIGDMDINTWLKSVKVILAELVGFDNGIYYDVLAANAYGKQLVEEVRPLTEKQKKNITKYWKGGEIAKILFAKNQQVIELARAKVAVNINDISSVPVEQVMETITGKYKNKVVLVDLWATWCGPCVNAMQQFSAAKDEFRDQDVTFVYLTNESSPKKLWEEKIQGIGSEHYYLTPAQWEHVMEKYNFEVIPSYLLFDKQGKMVDSFTGFPGSDVVERKIKSLL